VRATGVDSRRFLRELNEAPGGNNLQYILKCPCIPFFSNQGLHNEIMLGGNGRHSGVMCEGSPYIYPPSKVTASRSNGSGIENGVEVFFGKYRLKSSDVVGQNKRFLPCLHRLTGSFCKFLGDHRGSM